MENVNSASSRITAESSQIRTSEGNSGDSPSASIANVLCVLLLYSVAMFTLPIGAYFGVHRLLRDEFGIKDFSNTVWSVLAAVLVVNMIIASYALRAYNEEKTTRHVKIYTMVKKFLSNLNLAGSSRLNQTPRSFLCVQDKYILTIVSIWCSKILHRYSKQFEDSVTFVAKHALKVPGPCVFACIAPDRTNACRIEGER
ncbi:hypothetical protein J437_LFUL015395 [Ladona fulva]|uniref:Uncharacterized protein n=1 Tax=Ladona fulva TaxID=123851 RepID=A0A8K0KIN1_LADFU|nr:hypothetical protein J437_LFUL015395 [Ladona fulva]